MRRRRVIINCFRNLRFVCNQLWRSAFVRRNRILFCYLLCLALIGTLILGSFGNLSPVNAAFFGMGAVSGSSLAPSATSELTNPQNTTLLFLMLFGGKVVVMFFRLLMLGFGDETKSEARNGCYDYAPIAGVDVGDMGSVELLSYNGLPHKNEVIRWLSWVILGYIVIVQILGILVLIIYLPFVFTRSQLREIGVGNTWAFSIFITVSAFSNCGYVYLEQGMMPFSKCKTVLLTLAFQMALGNAFFVPCVRAILWTVRSCAGQRRRIIAGLLLKNPEIFTVEVFDLQQTIWIAVLEVGLVGIQMGFLCGLEWNGEALKGLNSWEKVVVAVFQAVSTRTTGFNAITICNLSPTIIYLFLIMMYMPSRLESKTVNYEQNSEATNRVQEEEEYFVAGGKFGAQLEKMFLRYRAHVVVISVIICVVENDSIKKDPLNFSILNMVFDIISAFGNVGLSVGYKDVSYSLCGKWASSAKLLLLPLMVAGRFR